MFPLRQRMKVIDDKRGKKRAVVLRVAAETTSYFMHVISKAVVTRWRRESAFRSVLSGSPDPSLQYRRGS